MATTVSTPRRRRAGIVAGGVVAVAGVVLLWDWNWLKPLAEARASAALNRKVTIGHIDVDPGRSTWIVLDDVVVLNPPEMPQGTLGSVGRLSVHLDVGPLVRGRVVLRELIVERLRGDLRPAPSGVGNWELGLPPRDPDAPPSTVEIGTLTIIDGSAHFLDPRRGADFSVLMHTEGERILVSADGTYAGQAVTVRLAGGALLGLRDPANPYRIDASATNGAARVELHGTLVDPLRFGGAKVQLELRGHDLAALFPLTGIPLPPTPPYTLKGGLHYEHQYLTFSNFEGRVGGSDLSGDLVYDTRGERPRVLATLVSKKIVLADLAGFIGATPGETGAPNETAGQKSARDTQEAKPTLLPDKPINLPKLRAVDFHVAYKGERIETKGTPLDNIVAALEVVDGKLTLHPLSFGVGTGQIVLNLALDGQEQQVHVVADVDFRKVDLRRIMKSTMFSGAGMIGGRGRIDTTGNSLKTMLGRGDGELQLFMTKGDISALLVDLAGIDLGNAVLSAVGIPRRAHLRCMIADFGLQDGQVETRTLLIDTTEANVIGSGAIDLTAETIDYRIRTEPKHLNVGSLRAPILIRGPLKAPRVAPQAKGVALRGGAAVVFGVLLTPFAALIPTVQLGLGEDNDCVALLRTVGAPASPPPPATRSKMWSSARAD